MTLTDPVGLNPGSLTSNDIVVVGPNGAALPVTYQATTIVSSTEDIVTYQVSPPQPGNYQIDLIAGQIADVVRPHSPAQTLGGFQTSPPAAATTTPGSVPQASGTAGLVPTQIKETLPPNVIAGTRVRAR